MQKVITGIQQVGVGVANIHEAFDWYRKHFGMDIKVFDDESTAELMLPHTDGMPRIRHAILAMNLQGGGGFEIWQHKGFEPKDANFELMLGDLGIFITKLKSSDIHETYRTYREKGLNILGEMQHDPADNAHFFVKDPYNNIFQVIEEKTIFKPQKSANGGICGCTIGVSDIDRSMKLYAGILGYNTVVYDKNEVFGDLAELPAGNMSCRRVLLKHSKIRIGPFSALYGPTQIELVQVEGRKPQRIFENRIWGEKGFIHLCFDIVGMDALRNECLENGYPFTVDSSNSFDMGEAAGHFSYIEDPDGTLIEFVETHRVPIIKKLGWYINLKDRKTVKRLPNWMVSTLAWKRVKD